MAMTIVFKIRYALPCCNTLNNNKFLEWKKSQAPKKRNMPRMFNSIAEVAYFKKFKSFLEIFV